MKAFMYASDDGRSMFLEAKTPSGRVTFVDKSSPVEPRYWVFHSKADTVTDQDFDTACRRYEHFNWENV